MKRIILTAVAVMLVVSIFMLCGCETTVNLDGTTGDTASTTFPPATVVVDVTDSQGVVISTATVTMSNQEKEEEKNFFTPIVQDKVPSQVLPDRLQQALQNQQAIQNLQQNTGNTTNTAPDINGDNSGGGSSAGTPDVNIPYIQDDAAVLRSSQYMINVRLVDSAGVAQNYKIAKNGKNSSVSMIYNEVPMGIILGEEMWYLLSVEDKTYIEIPKELVKENSTDDEFTQLILGDPFNFDRPIVSQTRETQDGITYDVVEYDNGNKDYFVGKTIIKTTATDNSVMYYDSVSAIAPMSLFVPPADYTKQVVTEENASELVDSLSPTDVSAQSDDNE